MILYLYWHCSLERATYPCTCPLRCGQHSVWPTPEEDTGPTLARAHCRVYRWDEVEREKEYDAIVLFMGKRSLWNATCWQLLYWLSHCLSDSKTSVAKKDLDWAASHGHDSFSTEAVEDMTSDESSHQTETKRKCRRQRKRKNQKEVHVWHLTIECSSVGLKYLLCSIKVWQCKRLTNPKNLKLCQEKMPNFCLDSLSAFNVHIHCWFGVLLPTSNVCAGVCGLCYSHSLSGIIQVLRNIQKVTMHFQCLLSRTVHNIWSCTTYYYSQLA